ncbi:hypothetical protein MCEMSE15_00526 [Fimbriimonadaceae bacterium]
MEDTHWLRLIELAMLLILTIALVDVWTDRVDVVLALSYAVVFLTVLGFSIRPRNLTALRLEPAEAIATETIVMETFQRIDDSPLARIVHL